MRKNLKKLGIDCPKPIPCVLCEDYYDCMMDLTNGEGFKK